MKQNTTLLAAITLTLAFTSCQKKETTATETTPASKVFAQLNKASWLVGEWGNTSKEGVLTETWTTENDSTYTGKTYFITGKDTAFTETIQLMEKNNELHYMPTISDQNEGKQVTFLMTSATDKQLVFENKEHDFPQKITYNKITNDSIVAEIFGMKDGKESKESYPLEKK